jgi:hypothetical protein
LADGGQVILDPSSMVANGGEILVLGTPTTLWPPGANRRSPPRSQREAVGVVVDASGRARIVPPPLERETFMARATRAEPGAWDVLFFTTSVERPLMQHVFDSATIWTGRFEGTRWQNVRPVAEVRDARLLPDHSSELVRHRNELRFAYSFQHRLAEGARPYQWPGIAMLRGRDGTWRIDTLLLRPGAARSVHLAPAGDTATMVIYAAEYFRPGYIGSNALHAAVHTDRWGPASVVVRDSGMHLDILKVSAIPRGWTMSWRREYTQNTTVAPDSLRWGRLLGDQRVERAFTIEENLPAARPALIEYPPGRTVLVTADPVKRVLRAYLEGDAKVTPLAEFQAPVSLPRLRSVVLDSTRAALWTTSQGTDEAEPFIASHLVLVRLHCDSTRARQRSIPSSRRGRANAIVPLAAAGPGDMRRRDHRLP